MESYDGRRLLMAGDRVDFRRMHDTRSEPPRISGSRGRRCRIHDCSTACAGRAGVRRPKRQDHPGLHRRGNAGLAGTAANARGPGHPGCFGLRPEPGCGRVSRLVPQWPSQRDSIHSGQAGLVGRRGKRNPGWPRGGERYRGHLLRHAKIGGQV